MQGIEVNVQTGQQRTVELTAKEVEQHRLAYEASQKLATWDDIRAKRDQLIRESDWTMVPDASVDQAQWVAYRQILRDLPQTYAESGPESVVWPTQPSTAGPNSTPVE
jgi:hypothetical protein